MTKLFERGFACFDLNLANSVSETTTNNNSTAVSAILTTTKVVRVACITNAVHLAMDGTATRNNLLMPVGSVEYFNVPEAGLTPAIITAVDGSNGTLTLTEFDS